MAYLMTGLSVARVGALAAAIDDGLDPGTAELASGTYAHRDLSGAGGVAASYTDLATAVQLAMSTVLTTLGATVTFSLSTLRYTVTFGGSGVIDFRTATLGDDRGKRMAAALGFNYAHANAVGGSASDPFNFFLSGAVSFTSNVAPYYLFELSRDGISDYEPPYEKEGQTKRVESSLGNAFSIGPRTRVQHVDWTVRFQTRETVLSRYSADEAWTYEDLVKHARAWEPILLHTTELDLVCLNREGDFHRRARQPEWSNYHGRWSLPFRGQYVGEI